MKVKSIITVFCLVCLLASCMNRTGTSDKKSKDRIETVHLTVAPEMGKHYNFLDEPIDGIKIKEDKADDWSVLPLKGGIEGFDYELGYEYRLEVAKTHLANPPADGSSIRYKLVKINSKMEVSNRQ